MAEMSPGTALRELQKAQAGMKKARELLKQAQGEPASCGRVFGAGWESLTQAHRLMAAIPADAADDDVLTKQLAVGRYATALAGPAAPAQAARSRRSRPSLATTTTISAMTTARIEHGMARPKNPRQPVAAAPGCARPEPDAGRTVADDGDPRCRDPSIRLSQDARRPGRCGHAQPRRHRARGRSPRRATGICPLERPVADQLAVLVAPEHAARARSSGAAGSTTRSPANDGPRPGPRDECLSRRPCRGGWSLRPDRRPVRRRPFGRGLQPGNLSADRPDPVAARRAAGDEALSSRSRRAGRAAGRFLGPAARQPAPAAARDRAGTWNSLPHPFRRRPQDGLLLRSARQPPRARPVLSRAGPCSICAAIPAASA